MVLAERLCADDARVFYSRVDCCEMSVTEKRVEQALSYLVESSEPAAEARSERVVLEAFGKRLVAMIMMEHLDLSVSAQEREALADMRYQEHLDGLKEAIRKDESNRNRRSAEEAVLEYYRTYSANTRRV